MHIKLLLWLIAISAIAAACEAVDQPASAVQTSPERIINGTPTNYESWKGVLGIWATTSGTVCTGTLIHPRIILTGGHCVLKNSGSIRFNFVNNPKPLRIYGGADIRVWEGVTPIEYSRVSQVVAHPEWLGKVHSADLAMLLLAQPITAADVTPFELRNNEASVEDEAHLVGYGRTQPEDNTSDGHPMEASATIVSIATRAGEGPYTVLKTGRSDAAVCSGDSGGPLFTEQGGQWVVTGVASMGDCYGDNLNVNLANHLDWIDETMCELVGQGLPGGACGAQDTSESDSWDDTVTPGTDIGDATDDRATDSDDAAERESSRDNAGCRQAPHRHAPAAILLLAALL